MIRLGAVFLFFITSIILVGQNVELNNRIYHYDSLLNLYIENLDAEGSKLNRDLDEFIIELQDVDFSAKRKARLIVDVSRFPLRTSYHEKRTNIASYFTSRKWQRRVHKKCLYFIDAYERLNAKVLTLEALRIVDQEGNYLDPDYSYFISELEFYDLHDGLRLGEIGAGQNARFSRLILQIFDFEQLFVNELGDYNFSTLKKHFKDYISKGKMKLVNGRKKSTKLEDKELDKVIIRNAYHHFKKEDKMLQSIKKALKPDGILYLSEPVFYLRDDPEKGCIYAISRDEIIEELTRNGFSLKKEREAGNYLLMKFMLN